MTTQVLSAKNTRKLARAIGDPTITRAWVDPTDHKWVCFVTWGHDFHGIYNRKQNVFVELDPDHPSTHEPFCYDGEGNLLAELDPFDDDGRWPNLKD